MQSVTKMQLKKTVPSTSTTNTTATSSSYLSSRKSVIEEAPVPSKRQLIRSETRAIFEPLPDQSSIKPSKFFLIVVKSDQLTKKEKLTNLLLCCTFLILMGTILLAIYLLSFHIWMNRD